MKTIAVIGKNFGDEGKGLVTASLSSFYKKPLIIRHNGGGQSGHTVENEKSGKRFVHHQIGSGAEFGVPTLFAETFHPDLFQLEKEVKEFYTLFGFLPEIFAEPGACITTIDDVLLNMAIETERGNNRHGSCGMGINECCERISAGFPVSLEYVAAHSTNELVSKLNYIKKEYTLLRAEVLNISKNNPYYKMLLDNTITVNFAEAIKNNLRFVKIISADAQWINRFQTLIFETGQGLLLDEGRAEYAPHLTSSKTGTAESIAFLKKREMSLDEAIYVTRPYVTRHGAGPLEHECGINRLPFVKKDVTNLENEWQGQIRYARHPNVKDFLLPVLQDAKKANIMPSLAVTHLDETKNMLYFYDGDVSFESFLKSVRGHFLNIYFSQNRSTITQIY